MSVTRGFADLPTELRLVIWAEAVLLDNKNRVLILEHQYKRILATRRLLRASGVFGATRESREVALELYPARFPFQIYYVYPRRPQWYVDDTAPRDGVVPREEVEPLSDRVIHVSFSRDIFFLGLGGTQWDQARRAVYPQGFPNASLFHEMRRTTVPLSRWQRGRIQRVMEATQDSPWTQPPPSTGRIPRLLTAADLGPLDHRFSHPSNNNVYHSVRECYHILTDDDCSHHANTLLIDIIFRDPLGVHGMSADADVLGSKYPRLMRQPCLEHDQLLLSCDITAYRS